MCKSALPNQLQDACVNIYIYIQTDRLWGSPGGSLVKNLPTDAAEVGLIPGLGRSPGEGNGNPLQYSCLENPMDRGAWRATVLSQRSWTQLNN